MTVWVAHPLKDDISAAQVYGDVQYVNTRYIYADEISGERIPDLFWNRMEQAANQFDPDGDYLLIAGDHLQLIAFAALLAERWGTFKVLRFDREARGYFVVDVSLGEYRSPTGG